MHEASLVKSLLKQVEALMDRHSASRVSKVNVTLGEFSGVEPELLQIAFDRLSPQSLVAGATMCVNRTPLVGQCNQCGIEFSIEKFRFICGHCGNCQVRVTGGEEMLLESVVMEAGA